MKKNFHPVTVDCEVSCACGNSFNVLSTQAQMKVDICNKCHPFFTGQNKMVDTTGRIEKFKKKYGVQ